MPEYLAPGVFVEEVSFRAKSIEGVSTTTTGFIGPTRYGPLDIEPDIVTSLVEFERTYGGKERLQFGRSDDETEEMDNYMWHAARAFFEEGGKRLYVSRVYTARALQNGQPDPDPAAGCSVAELTANPSPAGITIRARFPGAAGDARVTLTFNVGQNVLVDADPTAAERPALKSVRDRDVVLISDRTSPPTGLTPRGFFLARRDAQTGVWTFEDGGGTSTALALLSPAKDVVQVVTVSVFVDPIAPGAPSYSELNLPLDPFHKLVDTPDSVFDAFAPHTRDPANPEAKVIASLSRARTVPIVIENAGGHDNGLQVFHALLGTAVASPPPVLTALESQSEDPQARSLVFDLTHGNDGLRPEASAYEGAVDPATDAKTGFFQFEDLEDISIVAAPGSTFGYEATATRRSARAIISRLISHAAADALPHRGARQRQRPDRSPRCARCAPSSTRRTRPSTTRGCACSTRSPQREIYLPPSRVRRRHLRAQRHQPRRLQGAGQRGRERSRSASRRSSTRRQQDVLNPEGINCFRFFEGRGYPAVGRAHRSARTRSGSTSTCAATSPTSSTRSTRARSGPSSSRTASSCGPTSAARSRTSCSTSGRTARCSATSRRRRTSCSATARR